MATILVVDDVADNRGFLVALLEYHGHRMLEAADGREGLATAHANHPDLVITDVLMPVMDGYELVKQLRLDPNTSRIPVVFYTAHYAEREAKALALSSGVSDVLIKPVESATVLEVVSRVLAEGSASNSRDVLPLTTEFDRKHLRLLTDKLSEKAGDLLAANAQLRTLINIGVELASEEDPERRLQSVCASVRDLFGATYVTIGILDRTNGTLRRLVTCGSDESHWIKAGEPLPGILGRTVAERRTFRGNNPGGNPDRLGLPAGHPEARAFLSVPIASSAHVFGWICLVANNNKTFTEDDEHLVVVFAGQLGRLYELESEIVERHQAEKSLRHERDRTQSYLNTAAVMLLALDMEGRITLVNRHASSVLGWTADELIGRDWFNTCIPVRLRDRARKRFQDMIGGDLAIFESLILTKFGEQRLIEWRNTAVRNDEGQIIRTFSSGSDITERKRAEEEIRNRAKESAQAEREFRALFAANPLAMWIYDLTTLRFLEVNEAAIRQYGFERDEFLAMTIKDIRPPEDVAGLLALVGQPREPWQQAGTWRHRTKFGQVIDVDITSHAITFTEHSAALVVAQDITERQRSAKALQTAEERTRFALEAAGVGIWDMDYALGVLQWSETLETQHGLRPRTFGGTFEAWLERVHPEDQDALVDTMANATRSGSDFSMHYRTLWPDGSVRWLTGAGRIRLGADGAPLRGLGISLDVTERHTLEAQYQQAQKMEAVGRLAGGVAHDFNNLLTAILGYCELLLADLGADDPRKADIAEIQKAGESAAGLTRQLLAFSRKEILQPTLLDLNVVVTDLRSLLGRLLGEDVSVMLGLRSEAAFVKADRAQVEQIVVNLAVNARDAMEKGGTLTIETANVELDEHYIATHIAVTPGAYVVLRVSDTGTGMTPEVKARLFEPFFTTKEIGKGTGLGLATVHGIVARSGGSVNVYSEVGRGTSISVYFPSADTTEALVEAPPEAARASSGAETVLVVEDAEGLRELTKRLLERQGYTVLVAGNAEEALREFERNASIDVILTDVVMPGVSGPELTKELVERRPGLKVVYMSGYTEDAIVQHGVLKAGIAFLHKPFTSEALGRKIRDVLDR
jgi:two-component system, cell cycle sensor histidine kinase and response regulator CckA